jgi:tetratricopeptide (TPR) repeat protein
VCGATEAILRSLREKSLIRLDGDRFSMLATIREFALEQLGSQGAEPVARKHAEYFVGLAESANARTQAAGPDPAVLDELGRDYDNFRAALGWAHEAGQTDLFARLAAALSDYWSVRGPHQEARRWLEAALVASPADVGLRTRVAVGLGLCCSVQGDYSEAVQAHHVALEQARSSGDRETEASTLGNLGGAELVLGNHTRARELLTESEQLIRELGKEVSLAGLTNMLGVIELVEGRLDEAELRFRESLRISERIVYREGASTALLNLGVVLLRSERLQEAASCFEKSMRLAEELQATRTTAYDLQGLAAVAAQQGNASEAGRLLGVADSIREEGGVELEPFFIELERETRAAVRSALGAEAASKAFASGSAARAGV